MATEPYIGRWKIVECISHTDVKEDADLLRGCEFDLLANGDVVWHIEGPKKDERLRKIPLFRCRSFEVLRKRNDCLPVFVYLRFGSYKGNILEFEVEESGLGRNITLLCYKGWCTMHCKKITSLAASSDVVTGTTTTTMEEDKKAVDQQPFDFLPALEEGFFSDVVITGESGKEFKVHSTILNLAMPGFEVNSLDRLPDNVLSTILYYFYGQCLPKDVPVRTLEDCIQVSRSIPGLKPFIEKCELYLRNSALKEKIMSLVREMHSCANAIITEFGGKPINPDPNAKPVPFPEMLIHNPTKLSESIKMSLRNVTLGFVKFIHLGNVFATSCGDLSAEEQHEIVRFVKMCLPIFLKQVHRFLSTLRQHTMSLNLPLRQSLAAHFIPELESLSDSISRVGFDLKEVLEIIIESGVSELASEISDDQPTPKSLKYLLLFDDLNRLRRIHAQLTYFFSYLVQEKEIFVEMGSAGKIRTLSWQIEQIVDELPLFLLRLEEFSHILDDRLDFGTFKFCFYVASTFLESTISKCKKHKSEIKSLLDHLCSLIQLDEFRNTLIDLGILDDVDDVEDSLASLSLSPTPNLKGFKIDLKLSLVEKLCKPPMARENILASNTAKLFLANDPGTDMIFRVEAAVEEKRDIPGHRVIVSARCDWFRRALLSGMREAIQKRIIVNDTTPQLFTIFLEFVYSGILRATDNLNCDQLSELLLLSDRYEMDSLKLVCESVLKSQIDSESAISLLSIADQFNAANLRASCIEFVGNHHELLETDLFLELPKALQNELETMVSWGYDDSSRQQGLGIGGSGSRNLAAGGLINLATNTLASPSDFDQDDSISSLPLTHDSSQLEMCVGQLRDVLGPLIAQDQLVRVALAADYDVNRALNYFFSSTS